MLKIMHGEAKLRPALDLVDLEPQEEKGKGWKGGFIISQLLWGDMKWKDLPAPYSDWRGKRGVGYNMPEASIKHWLI